jgi:SAM-dependent methyltransferase
VSEARVKQSVRSFYDEVGWQQVSEGVYQNAMYEDLRPVSREYIHNCHMRVNRYLAHKGKYLLDAGSGPIQYPAYLTYSEGYQYRICLDISIIALFEARERIAGHGLFVVSDIANLPFAKDTIDDIVTLHTIHHVPREDYPQAYRELKRVLKPGGRAVVVNGWDSSSLMRLMSFPVKVMERLLFRKPEQSEAAEEFNDDQQARKPEGTFVHKLDAKGLRDLLGEDFKIDIKVWRSVSVRFLRAMIHPFLLGRLWLKILFLKEELFPRFFGEKGQYPLVLFKK